MRIRPAGLAIAHAEANDRNYWSYAAAPRYAWATLHGAFFFEAAGEAI